MQLTILHGRSGTGKSARVLRGIGDLMDREPDARHFLLVPEQMSFLTEKRVLDTLGDRAGMAVRVMGINRLAWHAFSATGGTSAAWLDKTGRHILLHQLIRQSARDLPLFSRSLHRNGFAAVIGDAVSEFKRYGVKPEVISEQAQRMPDRLSAQKLKELSLLAAAYEAALNGRVDSEDRLIEAVARLERMPGLERVHVWVDQFQSFSPVQMRLLQAAMRRAASMTVSMLTDDPDGGHPLFRTANRAITELIRHAREHSIPVSIQSAGTRNLRHAPGSALARVERLLMEDRTGMVVHADPSRIVGRTSESRPVVSPETAASRPVASPAPAASEPVSRSDVFLIRAENPYRELQRIARKIVCLCREEGIRFRDMAVLVPKGSPYDVLVVPMFRMHGIPCFVDNRRSLSANPVAVAVTGLLDWVRGNWQHDDILRVLRTGLLPLAAEETDRLENYLLACGIRGRREWEAEWQIDPQDAGVTLETLNTWRIRLSEPVLRFRRTVRGNMPVGEVLRAYITLLTDFGIPERVQHRAAECRSRGDLEAEAHARQVWRAFCGMMDQIHVLLEGRTTNLNDLQQLVKSGLESSETAIIPPSLDEVAVGGLERSRMAHVRVLFIAGAVDGWFPPETGGEGLLTDRERDLLMEGGVALAPNSRALAQERLNDAYLAVSAPTDALHVSWPAADMEGRSLRPSPLLHRMRHVLPDLTEQEAHRLPEMEDCLLTTPAAVLFDQMGPFSPEPAGVEAEAFRDAILSWFMQSPVWRTQAQRVLEGRCPDNRPKPLDAGWLAGFARSTVFTSASALEQYRRCPFSHFAQSMLRLKERRDDVFRASDFGTVMHQVMENAVKLAGPDPEAWDRFEGEELERVAAAAVEGWEAARKTAAILPPGYAGWYRRRLVHAARQAIGAVTHHIRSGRFRPLQQELTFGRDGAYPALEIQLPDGGCLYLQGRLDRLDTWSEGGTTWLRVVDYKSGGRAMSLSDCVEGLDIQLPAYLSAALAHHRRLGETALPGGLFFMRLEPPEIHARTESTDETGRERRKRMKLTGYVLDDDAVVNAMDETLLGGGSSDVIPVMRKQDGSFGSRSKTLSEADFSCLMEDVARFMASAGTGMRAGRIDIRPVRTDTGRACEFCPYGTFCAFEPGVGALNWERVRQKTDAEILEIWQDRQREDRPGTAGGAENGQLDD